ncbi:MAG: hypothetical protein ACKOFI_12420, partial [Phycisphaerales bacterium]
MRGAGVAAVAATAAAFAAAVAWPCAAGMGLFASGGAVPATFDAVATVRTTVLWSVAIALCATVLGWPVGRAVRRAQAGRTLLAISVVAAALPPYAVFWSWWQAAGPGSWLGDWCAVHGMTGFLREALLAVGLVSWAWPIAAWFVAARPADDRLERELGRVDGDRAGDRLARAWRADRAALALAASATAFVVSGLTVAFDLAQVRTFGFELRTLDVQGVPVGAVLRAAWPAISVAAIPVVAIFTDLTLACATSGISALRAVYPAGSKIAPRTARAMCSVFMRPSARPVALPIPCPPQRCAKPPAPASSL